jgi:hypothetical protein
VTEFAIELVDRGLIGEDESAEFPLVAEANVRSITEMEGDMLEPDGRVVGGHQQQASGHPEVGDEDETVVEVKREVLAAAARASHGAANEGACGVDAGKGGFEDGGEVAQGDSGNGLAGHMRIEDAADGFDLWQFWHDECSGPFGGNETGWSVMPVFLVA